MRYLLAAVDFFKGHEGPLMLCNDRGFCREFVPPPEFFLDLSRWFNWFGVLVLAVGLSACGGSSSPVAPTPQAPNISGQWTGNYRVLSCNEQFTGGGACAGIGGGGPHTLTPSQSAGNFTGQLGIGLFSVPVSGNVDAAGVVTLAGSGPVSFATLTITSWRAVVSGATMTGSMNYSVFADGAIVFVTATTTLSR